MKIAVAGVGYVGLSLAVLFAQNHEVIAVTTTPEKAEKLNRFISPIQDAEIATERRKEGLPVPGIVIHIQDAGQLSHRIVGDRVHVAVDLVASIQRPKTREGYQSGADHGA